MGEVNLKVPYKSQHGADSKQSNADCGAASEAMVLEFFGRPSTVGQVLQKLNNPKGFINWDQLKFVAEEWGFQTKLKSDAKWEHIQSYLDQGIPVIVVGGYGYLTSTQDKTFKSSHIMVVVGYRPDGSVYVNDPNFWGDLMSQGDHHVYTRDEFARFWQNAGNTQGNRPNTLFVITPKAQANLTPRVKVTAIDGVRVRREPTTGAKNIVRLVNYGVELGIFEKLSAESVNGVNTWYKVIDGYCWGGAVTEVVPLPNGTPPAPSEPIVLNKPDEQQKIDLVTPAPADDLYTRLTKENEALKKENSDLKTALKQFTNLGADVSTLIEEPKNTPTAEFTKNRIAGYWDKLKIIFHL